MSQKIKLWIKFGPRGIKEVIDMSKKTKKKVKHLSNYEAGRVAIRALAKIARESRDDNSQAIARKALAKISGR